MYTYTDKHQLSESVATVDTFSVTTNKTKEIKHPPKYALVLKYNSFIQQTINTSCLPHPGLGTGSSKSDS